MKYGSAEEGIQVRATDSFIKDEVLYLFATGSIEIRQSVCMNYYTVEIISDKGIKQTFELSIGNDYPVIFITDNQMGES